MKTKNLNIWCDVAEVWIPEQKLVSISRPIDWSIFNPDEDLCYVGVDLSAVSDLAAVAYDAFICANGSVRTGTPGRTDG